MQLYFMDDISSKNRSTAIIERLKELEDKNKFIYYTPSLDEVERVEKALSSKDAISPKEKSTSRLKQVEKLIKEKRNIVVNNYTLLLVLRNKTDLTDYTLVMDKAINLTSTCLNTSKEKVDWLIDKGYVTVCDKTRLLKVTCSDRKVEKPYDSLYNDIKLGYMFMKEDGVLTREVLPETLKKCKQIIMLGYMTEGQYLYQEFANKLDCRPVKIMAKDDNSGIMYWSKDKAKSRAVETAKLITTFKDGRCREAEIKIMELLKDCVYSEVNADSDSVINSPFLSKINLEDSNISYIRSLGNYRTDCHDKTVLVYLMQDSPTDIIVKQEKLKDKIDIFDLGDLNTLIEWIFKSPIRDGKQVSLLIPAPRLKDLYNKWADGSIFDSMEGIK